LNTEATRVLRWEAGSAPVRQTDDLAAEEPLEIQIDTRPVSVTMRTPGHDEELATGFLLTQGLIQNAKDIAESNHIPQSVWQRVEHFSCAGNFG
jgi:FdhD protein